MTPVISLNNAGFTYNHGKRNARPVFSGLDLWLEKGETLGITGVSGHGKTTLLKVMAGLAKPTSGSVEICGTLTEVASRAELTRLRRRYCGFVTQRGDLDPYLTVMQNIMLAGGKPTKAFALELLESMGLDPKIFGMLPQTLSGGERQRVALAVALAGNPSILFADEPTSALDPESEKLVLDAIKATVKPATTVVIVSHHMAVVESICTRSVHMQNGVLIPV